ncbi:MAG: 1-acyl-sn-glycerol-3-phosphate acyltransferase [Candidatus Nanopelagicales bacterium]
MNPPIPPVIIRRLVIAPAVLLLGVVSLMTVPLLLITATLISFWIPGKWRPLRLLGFALVYLAIECVGLLVCFLLWVLSGFGWKVRSPRFVEAHYRLMQGCLTVLYAAGTRLFKVRVVTDGVDIPAYDDDPTTIERPLIVMSRHAGPGDSFLIAHEIMSWTGRRPRIVVKDSMQLDPLIDVLLSRIPAEFVTPSDPSAGTLPAIERLATGMATADALLIFPEGGNFTEQRRTRAIEKLRAAGHLEQAAKAERLTNVLPPRPKGLFAALDGCPDADVVVVGHTGLDRLNSLRDVWRELPMDKTILLRWRRIPPSLVPTVFDLRVAWLYDLWAEIDDWIEDQQDQLPSSDAH